MSQTKQTMTTTDASVYFEGGHWRWAINRDGRCYTDGGNYLTKAAAIDGLRAALATFNDEVAR